MTLFSIIGLMQGLPLQKAAEELNRINKLSVVDFLAEQEKRKWAIFQYHSKKNSVYANKLNNRSIQRWEDIPILQKSDIQRPLTEVLSEGCSDKNIYKNNTSGSTGKPFHFAKDKFAHAMTWAYIINQYRDLGLEYGRSLQARFFGIPLSRSKYLKEKVKDYLAARVRFPIFDLSDTVLSGYYQRFQKHSFEYVYGYTSSLVLFAKYLQQEGRTLKKVCPTLKWCIVTSEVCDNHDRLILQTTFGVPVINEYGAAELDIIGFENRDGYWRLNEENLYIEILGEDGQPVGNSTEGNVVVTSLNNKAMPFIRYNLGDVVSLMPERQGKHRLIKSIQGRVNDVATLPSGKRSPGLTFYYISKGLLEHGGFMKEFIIKQTESSHFHFDYVADRELSEHQKSEVSRMMDLYLEPGLTVSFERKEFIHRSGSGKFKHFQNLVPANL